MQNYKPFIVKLHFVNVNMFINYTPIGNFIFILHAYVPLPAAHAYISAAAPSFALRVTAHEAACKATRCRAL
jgi:hypothetical protein